MNDTTPPTSIAPPAAVRVGDRIRDNDSRMSPRVLTIWLVLPFTGYVIAEDRIERRYRIQLKRIHTDSKPRRSGFTLLPRE